MKTYFTILLSTYFLFSQNTPQVLFPSELTLLSFNAKKAASFDNDKELLSQIFDKLDNGYSENDLSGKEQYIYKNISETQDSYWDVIFGGCSWYCGKAQEDVTGTSQLPSNKKYTYPPKNAGDLDYQTAWVEGKNSYGVGESLTYHFESGSPRITKIIIANGYVKSEKTWRENLRVKKLNVYYNNLLQYQLNLKNSYTEQSFSVKPIGNHPKNVSIYKKELSQWELRFEIVEVYKGSKYKDTAISEIYFDGIDVH